MQVDRKIDAEARVVVLTVSGEIGDRELLSLPDQLEKDPEVRPDFALLIDLRQASGQKVTTAGVRSLAAQPLVLSPTSRRAVVVPTKLGFGMARMYEMLREAQGGGTRAFLDYGEPERWVAGSPRS